MLYAKLRNSTRRRMVMEPGPKRRLLQRKSVREEEGGDDGARTHLT